MSKIYYITYDKDGYRVYDFITTDDIKRIFSEVKIVDIENHEELPKGKVTIVGVSNDDYQCYTFWNLQYTKHDRFTYGGYTDESCAPWSWWTMNHYYGNCDTSKMYIVNNEEDGHKLRVFLNFIKGFDNINNVIEEKENKLKELQDNISFLREVKPLVNDWLNNS